MGPFENILIDVEDGIALVTLNRPKALNALNGALLSELDGLLDDIAKDKAIRAVILTGSGEKAFVAGADIAEMRSMSASEARAWGQFGQSVFAKIEALPQPVIAAINGFALGGGCELAMSCDIRVAAENAKFGQPEVTLGIIAGFGGTQRLQRLVGKGRAKEILFTGDMFDAAEALRIGLVNSIVPVGQVVDAARKLARRIASRASYAIELCKAVVNQGTDTDQATAIASEAQAFGLCFASSDQKEGMSAFLEKRKPHFAGC